MKVVKPVSPGEAPKEQPAGDFVAKMAVEIQDWLRTNALNRTDAGKRWVLTAILANGAQIVVDQLSAHGHSVIKVLGEAANGTPVLIVSHLHSVQFLASYVPREIQEPKNEPEKKREIGFHTGMGKPIKIEQ